MLWSTQTDSVHLGRSYQVPPWHALEKSARQDGVS